jgi:hypothetical protein
MGVVVDEARHDEAAAHIQRSRARGDVPPQRGARADGQDAITAHRDPLGPWARRVAGPDAAIENEVCLLRLQR